ncbi:MAG TPA: hypothetical protein DFS52_18115, partial [Myxococcales bacterium]|nr:hypothetical protein [Myxococcales bacterium]
PIMGNHDLALLRAVGWEGGPPDQGWFERMHRNYWNIGQGTDRAFGAHDANSLAGRMPKAHRDFLQALPWSFETEDYLFVHAGLLPKPLRPQLEDLGKRVLLPPFHLHPQLRDKGLATVSSPTGARSSSAAIRSGPACASQATDTPRTLPIAGASASRPRWTRAASCSPCWRQSGVFSRFAKATLAASSRRCDSLRRAARKADPRLDTPPTRRVTATATAAREASSAGFQEPDRPGKA